MTFHDESSRAAHLAPAPLRWLEHVSRCCIGFAKLALVFLSAVMAVTILLQVFLRYVVKASLPWSEELARYLMVWIGLMGASIAVHEGRHVGVSLLVDRTRGALRKAVTGIAMCGVLWFLWLMLSEGIRLVLNIWQQRSPAMNIPMAIPYAAIPLGAIFMMVQVVLGLSRILRDAEQTREG